VEDNPSERTLTGVTAPNALARGFR